ncbi:MAG TPA: sensor histidine kinase [Candidatus Acidoferrum sp.]|nr:sensor histidine kinase [Candidatus Acidoferrum sp.]
MPGQRIVAPSEDTDFKSLLIQELRRPDVNVNRVLELSDLIADSDPTQVRFTVDASHVERLGQELVSRKEIALAELIKNSYDADAHTVTVSFFPEKIVIDDDGNGMTREELVTAFMRISTPAKVDEPKSPRLKRERAGSKGIGRFAAHRLGRLLSVDTKASDSNALAVEINWDAFHAHATLTNIPNPIMRGKRSTTGTTLTISRLRDKWDDAAIDEALLFIGPLVQPFSLSSDDPGTPLEASDFQVLISRDPESKQVERAHDALRPLYDLAVAEIDAHVDERFDAVISVRSKRLKINVRNARVRTEQNGAFDQLRDVRLHAHYYIRNRPWIPPGPEGSVLKDALSRQGGIRLYRNDFRVHPYGEPNNDWLQLDSAYARRYTLLQAYGNQNFLGFIEVHDRTGTRFQETSSREGLLRTKAFEQLVDFAFQSLLDAVRLINESAAKKAAAERGDIPTGKAISARLRAVEKTANEVRLARGKQKDELIDRVVAELKKARLEVTRIEKRFIHEVGMLRVLATLGITVAEFVHEMRNTIVFLRSNLTGLIKSATSASAKEDLEDIQSNVKRLQTYTDYFHQAIVENESRELAPVDVSRAISQFRKFAGPLAQSRHIEVKTRASSPRQLRTVEMHESEFASVLTNLFSNSIKAIARAQPQGGIVEIDVSATPDDVILTFSDNGDGIPRERWERVFDAFESSTSLPSPRSRGADELTGMGLGLKIVRDTLSGRGGSIRVVEPVNGFSTTFRVTVPRAVEN